MLEKSPENQRRHKEALSDHYASIMSRGEWALNGEPIIISESGKMVDGQHRMQAVIKPNSVVDMVVVAGVCDSSFMSIDTGRKRTGGDVLTIAGMTNGNGYSSAAAFAWVYERARRTGGSLNANARASAAEILALVQTNEEIFSRALKAADKVRRVIPSATGSIVAGLYFVFSKHDNEDRSASFFDRIAGGSGLYQGDPELAIRNRFQSMVTGRVMKTHVVKRQVKAAYFCIAYKAFLAGRKISIFRWTEGRDPFPFV